jgi:myosin-5
MLLGMNGEELEHFLLDKYSVEDFKITSCSGTYGRRDGIKDADTYDSLVSALEVMGFSMEQQNDVFRIASAVLHLSNLTILPIKGGEECEIDVENEHLAPILQLLGVTKENLNYALCYFKIEARGQSYTRAVQRDKAQKGLEALMKATYSALFDYIVKTINSSITVQEVKNGSKREGGQKGAFRSHSSFIGVLDIFGFESFKTNSFEQLCINYCNEALQQQFNLFVLKKEQEEYEHEGINWSFIPFPDNQDVLDLIWKKGYGILNILDDQCRAPGTTDKTFASEYSECMRCHDINSLREYQTCCAFR